MRRALFLLLAATSVSAADPAEPASRPDRGAPASAAELERLLRELDGEILAISRRMEELQHREKEADARVLARGRAYVRLARAGLLPAGAGFEELVEHAVRLERLRRGLAADIATQSNARREQVRLGERLSKLRARRGPLESEHEARLRQETFQRSAEERERAFERAFLSGRSGDHSAVYGGQPPQIGGAPERFAARRGRLPLPVAGRTEIRRAGRGSGRANGLELTAAPGTPVRAVHAGRVAFADTYAEYGRTVILDHGGGHYTVSANLGSIDVTVGDELESGKRLGTVGASDRGALVYFEIRIKGEIVNAAEWVGL
ncbi:MAG TPA: peptidoglycan DD-metalloendopeptidase family protein [Polyangiaceae bacterium]|nr:peptidoglycan DD-metalloendopeptidase family protein [Polyangiaceae bacterium]